MDYSNLKNKQKIKVGAELITDEVKVKKEPVTTAMEVKQSLLYRFFKSIFGDRSKGSSLHEYLLMEVISPAIKNAIVDSVTSGINMIIYRTPGGMNNTYQNHVIRNNQTHGYNTQYNNRYRENKPREIQNIRRQDPRLTDYIIDSRSNAITVLKILKDQCLSNGVVSYADYLELINVESAYTDNNVGWFDLSGVQIVPLNGGYKLTLPVLEYL